jgi:hypothetical protein
VTRRHLAQLALVSAIALAAAAADPARAETQRLSVPLVGGIVDCTPVGGEKIVVDGGGLSAVLHVTTDANGGVHYTVAFRGDSVTLVGLTSGSRYRLVGAGVYQFNATQGAFEETDVQHGILLGPRGQNFVLFITAHTTVNANQSVTITIDKTQCLG